MDLAPAGPLAKDIPLGQPLEEAIEILKRLAETLYGSQDEAFTASLFHSINACHSSNLCPGPWINIFRDLDAHRSSRAVLVRRLNQILFRCDITFAGEIANTASIALQSQIIPFLTATNATAISATQLPYPQPQPQPMTDQTDEFWRSRLYWRQLMAEMSSIQAQNPMIPLSRAIVNTSLASAGPAHQTQQSIMYPLRRDQGTQSSYNLTLNTANFSIPNSSSSAFSSTHTRYARPLDPSTLPSPHKSQADRAARAPAATQPPQPPQLSAPGSETNIHKLLPLLEQQERPTNIRDFAGPLTRRPQASADPSVISNHGYNPAPAAPTSAATIGRTRSAIPRPPALTPPVPPPRSNQHQVTPASVDTAIAERSTSTGVPVPSITITGPGAYSAGNHRNGNNQMVRKTQDARTPAPATIASAITAPASTTPMTAPTTAVPSSQTSNPLSAICIPPCLLTLSATSIKPAQPHRAGVKHTADGPAEGSPPSKKGHSAQLAVMPSLPQLSDLHEVIQDDLMQGLQIKVHPPKNDCPQDPGVGQSDPKPKPTPEMTAPRSHPVPLLSTPGTPPTPTSTPRRILTARLPAFVKLRDEKHRSALEAI